MPGASKHTTGELIRKLLKAGCHEVGKPSGSHRYFGHEALPGRKIPVPHPAKLTDKGKPASYDVTKSVGRFLDEIEKAKKTT